LGVGGSRHVFDRDAMVDDGVVVHRVIVDDGGVIVDSGDLGRWQTMMAQIVAVKVSHGDEAKVVGVETEAIVHPDLDAIEAPT